MAEQHALKCKHLIKLLASFLILCHDYFIVQKNKFILINNKHIIINVL